MFYLYLAQLDVNKIFKGLGLTPGLFLLMVGISLALSVGISWLFSRSGGGLGAGESDIKRVVNRELAPLMGHRGLGKAEILKLLDENRQAEIMARQLLEKKLQGLSELIQNQQQLPPPRYENQDAQRNEKTIKNIQADFEDRFDRLLMMVQSLRDRLDAEAEQTKRSYNQLYSELAQQVDQKSDPLTTLYRQVEDDFAHYQEELDRLSLQVKQQSGVTPEVQALQALGQTFQERWVALQTQQQQTQQQLAHLQQHTATTDQVEAQVSQGLAPVLAQLTQIQEKLVQPALPVAMSSREIGQGEAQFLQDQYTSLQEQVRGQTAVQQRALLNLESELRGELLALRQQLQTLATPSSRPPTEKIVTLASLQERLDHLEQRLIHYASATAVTVSPLDLGFAPPKGDALSSLFGDETLPEMFPEFPEPAVYTASSTEAKAEVKSPTNPDLAALFENL